MKEQIINIDIYKRGVAILQDGCVGNICKWLEEHNATDVAQSVREEDWDITNAVTFSDGLDVYIISRIWHTPSLSANLNMWLANMA